jgi:two-component system, NarL family, sensor kinase
VNSHDISVGEIVESIRSVHWRESVSSTIELRHTSPSTRLPYDVANAAIRIANEAVENAQMHSNCEQLRVSLDVTSDAVTLIVSDDGEGMSPDEVERYLCQDSRHMGLRGMRMAAKDVGGRLSVSSSDQGGLIVEAVLPHAYLRHAAA